MREIHPLFTVFKKHFNLEKLVNWTSKQLEELKTTNKKHNLITFLCQQTMTAEAKPQTTQPFIQF